MPRVPRDHDEVVETPPAVVTAVSIGTAPLPFVAVYAVLFVLHGWLRPVHPPDITGSQAGELVAGIVAVVIFVVLSLTLWLFLNGRRRWPFVLGQLAVVGTTAWFLVDETKGGAVISALVLAASVVALGCGFAPSGWRHVGRTPPRAFAALYGERSGARRTGVAGTDATLPGTLPGSGEPSTVEPARLRRRRSRSSDV